MEQEGRMGHEGAALTSIRSSAECSFRILWGSLCTERGSWVLAPALPPPAPPSSAGTSCSAFTPLHPWALLLQVPHGLRAAPLWGIVAPGWV